MNYFIYFLILGMIIAGYCILIPLADHPISKFRIIKKFKTYPSHSEEEYFYPQVRFLWFFWRSVKSEEADFCRSEGQAKEYLREYLREHGKFKRTIFYYKINDLLNKD